ncbi:MAG TPA: hypothetical protein VEO18_09935 [Thermoplasmata archaeon]|nr:hypothetical protein [Thermoplasmata archaeon]
MVEAFDLAFGLAERILTFLQSFRQLLELRLLGGQMLSVVSGRREIPFQRRTAGADLFSLAVDRSEFGLQPSLLGGQMLSVVSGRREIPFQRRTAGTDLFSLALDRSAIGLQPRRERPELASLRVKLLLKAVEFPSTGFYGRFQSLQFRGGRPNGVDQNRWRLCVDHVYPRLNETAPCRLVPL